MSGGHFDYNDSYLGQIAERLRDDLRWDIKDWKPETLVFVRRMLKDVRRLHVLLHEYDWAISDDTCEDEFLQEAQKAYGSKHRSKQSAQSAAT